MAHKGSKDLTSGTLVTGLGRFGSVMAATLDKLGHEILAVERGPTRVCVLAGRFPSVEADATSMDALEQLGTREFRAAVTGAGSSSGSLVLITANLVGPGMPSIWTKATSRKHGRTLRRIGARHVIYLELDAGQRTAYLMSGRMINYIEVGKSGSVVMELCPSREVHSFILEDLDLRGRYGASVCGILRPGQPLEYAKIQTRVDPEDITIASRDVRLLEYFANRL